MSHESAPSTYTTIRRGSGDRLPRAAGPGLTALLVAAVLGLAAGPAAAQEPRPLGDPVADIERARTQVSLTTVSNDVIAPVAGITAAGHPGELYVVDQVGFLWSVAVGDPARWPVPARAVLDVTDLVVGPSRDGDERGFLGAAFSPTFAQDGLLYTYTSERVDPADPADFPVPTSTAPCALILPPDHQSVIREWRVTGSGASAVVDRSQPGQGRRVLAFEQPQFNHNGGDLDFGPDGLLYITSGDGGSGDDQDCQIDFDGRPTFGHPGVGNGQNLGTPLGKILRIDTRSRTDGAYAIPPANPFVGRAGALGEIFAYGFRNPFRASFDGGDLWVGDVGQNQVEEVDRVVAGGNYGWRLREGGFAFDPAGFDTHGFASDGFVFRSARGSLIDPVAHYDHDDGTAVIGGYVYRGSAMPALAGTYVFGDTSRRLNNRQGRIFGLDSTRLGPRPADNRIGELRDGPIDGQLIGWGEDDRRELYALIMNRDLTGGAVLRLGQAGR